MPISKRMQRRLEDRIFPPVQDPLEKAYASLMMSSFEEQSGGKKKKRKEKLAKKVAKDNPSWSDKKVRSYVDWILAD